MSTQKVIHLPYMTEATNNLDKTVKYLIDKGNVLVCCVYCESIKKYSKLDELENDFEQITDNCTMICSNCFVDAIVPITEDSKLYGLNNEKILEFLKDWKKQGFE